MIQKCCGRLFYRRNNWIVDPFDLSFQFGLQSDSRHDPETDVQHNAPPSHIPKNIVAGGKFLLRVNQTIRITLDEDVVSGAVRMYHAQRQFERWKLLRVYRPLVCYLSMSTVVSVECFR